MTSKRKFNSLRMTHINNNHIHNRAKLIPILRPTPEPLSDTKMSTEALQIPDTDAHWYDTLLVLHCISILIDSISSNGYLIFLLHRKTYNLDIDGDNCGNLSSTPNAFDPTKI